MSIRRKVVEDLMSLSFRSGYVQAIHDIVDHEVDVEYFRTNTMEKIQATVPAKAKKFVEAMDAELKAL